MATLPSAPASTLSGPLMEHPVTGDHAGVGTIPLPPSQSRQALGGGTFPAVGLGHSPSQAWSTALPTHLPSSTIRFPRRALILILFI